MKNMTKVAYDEHVSDIAGDIENLLVDIGDQLYELKVTMNERCKTLSTFVFKHNLDGDLRDLHNEIIGLAHTVETYYDILTKPPFRPHFKDLCELVETTIDATLDPKEFAGPFLHELEGRRITDPPDNIIEWVTRTMRALTQEPDKAIDKVKREIYT